MRVLPGDRSNVDDVLLGPSSKAWWEGRRAFWRAKGRNAYRDHLAVIGLSDDLYAEAHAALSTPTGFLNRG